MSSKKQGGKTRQGSRPNANYLGVKVSDGQKVSPGMVLIRQRGTKIGPGMGVQVGRDHTIFAISEGRVKFTKSKGSKIVSVL